MAFFGCKGGMSSAAISTDPRGRPGTWYKYDEGQFDKPGLGGTATPLPGLDGVHGVIYSVQYDSGLGLWLAWGREFKSNGVFVTASYDLVNWSPRTRRRRCPSLLSSHGREARDQRGRVHGSALLRDGHRRQRAGPLQAACTINAG